MEEDIQPLPRNIQKGDLVRIEVQVQHSPALVVVGRVKSVKHADRETRISLSMAGDEGPEVAEVRARFFSSPHTWTWGMNNVSTDSYGRGDMDWTLTHIKRGVPEEEPQREGPLPDFTGFELEI